uniref:Aquaporin n=1 Tax=Echinostoma caproni TaxID=27848 RepID=A0A183AAE2_9TREM
LLSTVCPCRPVEGLALGMISGIALAAALKTIGFAS